MLRRVAVFALLCACSTDDSGDDTTFGATCPGGSNCATTLPSGETAPGSDETASGASDGSSASASGSASGESDSSGMPGTGAESSSGSDPSCIAPTDCATCWTCASQGACATEYTACLAGPNCTPTLSCIADSCVELGVTQDCADMCCFSCEMLATCNGVNAAVACIAQQCAGLCGSASC